MDQKKIGEFILENRKKKNLTQNELAKKLKKTILSLRLIRAEKSIPQRRLPILLIKTAISRLYLS